jgi:heme exporter protein C
VQWWNTLHQGSTVKLTGTSMHRTMLAGMLVMALALWIYSIATTLTRARIIILERERRARWVRSL